MNDGDVEPLMADALAKAGVFDVCWHGFFQPVRPMCDACRKKALMLCSRLRGEAARAGGEAP